MNFGVLLILQHYSGLTQTKTIPEQIRAAAVAQGIGVVSSVVVLFALGVQPRASSHVGRTRPLAT